MIGDTQIQIRESNGNVNETQAPLAVCRVMRNLLLSSAKRSSAGTLSDKHSLRQATSKQALKTPTLKTTTLKTTTLKLDFQPPTSWKEQTKELETCRSACDKAKKLLTTREKRIVTGLTSHLAILLQRSSPVWWVSFKKYHPRETLEQPQR